MRCLFAVVTFLTIAVSTGCGQEQPSKPQTAQATETAAPVAAQAAETAVLAAPAAAVTVAQTEPKPEVRALQPVTTPLKPGPTILLAQAQFVYETNPKTGKRIPKPGPARLVILQPTDGKWQEQAFEDPDSNVFHKVAFYVDPKNPDAGKGILTIGANKAIVKIWRPTPAGWQAETLWKATFGGKQDRLRDYEIGDVTGDGEADIVIVTHDQGVVEVLARDGAGWKPIELDRKPSTIVHEVELGDLDGDGVLEIYATPSQPNRFDGKPQPGEIACYYHTPEGFKKRVVEAFPLRHVKEILCTNQDGSGRPVLLASVEAELATKASDDPDARKILLKRYHFENGQYVGEVMCTLPDKLCRFLNIGDVDGDGRAEIVASLHKQGLWLIRTNTTPWTTELIDKDSGGFEHATMLADLDGDGVQEIYVAADQQHEIRRYRWDGSKLARETLAPIDGEKITFGIYAGSW